MADDNVIDEAVVKISPDLSGFRKKLDRDLKKALTPQPVIKVKVAPDATGLRDKVRAAVATQMALPNQPVYKVKVVADTAGIKSALADREKQQVDSLRRMDRESEAATRRDVDRNRNATREHIKLAQQREKAFRGALKPAKLIDLGGEGVKPMHLLYSSIAALTPVLVAMSTSALQASTAVAALGAAGIGAGLAIGGLALAFGSITDAMALAKTVDNQKLVASAKDIASGTDDRARALRNLADAQRGEKDAYAAVHTARREAIRDLEDLRQSVQDLDNQYRSDRLSVREAEQAERATNANFFATALDRARAHQDTLDARARLAGTALERKQKRQDLARSLQKGIEGSDKVLQARESARDARDRRMDAQAAASKKSTAAAATGASAAAAQLAKMRKEMSAAGREMFDWLNADKTKEMFKGLRRTIEQGVLPGFMTFLKEVSATPKGGKSTLQLAAEYAGELGGIISKYAGRFGAWSKSPIFREQMATIQENNAKALETMGEAAETAMKPILTIITEASPLLTTFADKVLWLAQKFDKWIAGRAADGSLKKWFKDAATEAGKWYDIVVNLLTFLKGVFTASLPAGSGLVDAFRNFTAGLAQWATSSTGQSKLKAFFDAVGNLPYAQIRDMLVQFTLMFTSWATVKWALANPFFASLALLATSNPAAAAAFVSGLATLFAGVAKLLTAHPQTTTLLLTMLSLARLNKASGGILFNLTGLNKLRDVLTSKFKVLEQFTGGAKTATMTVQAGVVHVYGGGMGAPGLPGRTTPTPAGPGGTRAKRYPGSGAPATTPAREPGVPGRGAAVGNLAIIAGSVIGEALVEQIDTTGASPFKKAMKSTVSGTLSGAALGATVGGPVGAAVGAAIGAGVGLGVASWQRRQERMSTAQGAADLAFDQMTEDPELLNPRDRNWQGDKRRIDPQKILNRPLVRGWIDLQKKATLAAAEQEKQTNGVASAQKLQINQTQASVTKLADQLTKYGLAKDAAYKLAAQVFDLNQMYFESAKATDEARVAAEKAGPKYDEMGNALGTAAAQAQQANKQVIILGQTVDGVFKQHVLSLKSEGYEDVAAQLARMLNAQGILYDPAYSNSTKGADTRSSVSRYSDEYIAKHKLAGSKPTTPGSHSDPLFSIPNVLIRAQGGPISGPGTETSDSIPAWLSAGEYVLPAKAVRHYGVDYLDAMRQRQVPRFATGGPVGTMPFVVNLKGVKVPTAGELGYGTAPAPYTGKAPKGLGAVGGITAQMLAAAVDMHRQFPNVSVTSGLRTGRAGITVTGNISYHRRHRAIDLAPPSMELFNYLKAKYGRAIRELIYTPAGNLQVRNGKNWRYQDPRIVAGHYNHVHLALAQGGLVPARKYDSGGVLPPGYSLAFNGTGAPETVRTNKQERQLQGPIRLDRRDLAMLAASVHAGTQSLNMDGRRVAELTNKYNYLPAGV